MQRLRDGAGVNDETLAMNVYASVLGFLAQIEVREKGKHFVVLIDLLYLGLHL